MELGQVATGEEHILCQRREHKYQSAGHLANLDCTDDSGEGPSLTAWLKDISIPSYGEQLNIGRVIIDCLRTSCIWSTARGAQVRRRPRIRWC